MAPTLETIANAAGRTGPAVQAIAAASDDAAASNAPPLLADGPTTEFSVGVAAAAANLVETALAEDGNPQPRCPRGYNPVERSLFRQLTESTGADICDSGFAYGRGWERNRRIGDLKAQPYGLIDVEYGPDSPIVEVSTFHRLSELLMHAPAMNRRFARFNKRVDPDNEMSWLGVSEAFAERFDEEYTYYLSYSDEYSVLGQDVQFVGFNDGDGREFVLLQTHNGCDARGGYSSPVAYEVGEVDVFMCDLQRWTASCSCDGSSECESLRLDMIGGGFEPGGQQSWPDRWKVAANGTARCGVCREEVRVS